LRHKEPIIVQAGERSRWQRDDQTLSVQKSSLGNSRGLRILARWNQLREFFVNDNNRDASFDNGFGRLEGFFNSARSP
jgi:hypothetical protein